MDFKNDLFVIEDRVGDGYTFELIPGREKKMQNKKKKKKILYAFILQRCANDDVDNLNDYPFPFTFLYNIHV